MAVAVVATVEEMVVRGALLLHRLHCCHAQVLAHTGLCICVYDFERIGDANLHPGEGAAYTDVTFRLLVFRPFVGEVLCGTVLSSDKEMGVQVGIDFFDCITVPPAQLPQPSELYVACGVSVCGALWLSCLCLCVRDGRTLIRVLCCLYCVVPVVTAIIAVTIAPVSSRFRLQLSSCELSSSFVWLCSVPPVDGRRAAWAWVYDDQRMYLDEGEPVRFRVTDVQFRDTTGGRVIDPVHGGQLPVGALPTVGRWAGGTPSFHPVGDDLRPMTLLVRQVTRVVSQPPVNSARSTCLSVSVRVLWRLPLCALTVAACWGRLP